VDPGVVSIVPLGTADPDPRRATRTGVEQRWRVVAVLPPTPAVDIVIPVHNEKRDLARSVRRLHAYLKHEFPFSARITIADRASTDGTLQIASQLAADIRDVRLLRINENGRAAPWPRRG
jgi:cellulose synthase/poly-beta-1,6-N-acetylglucosamine synthase-like glycosyltransferase